MPKRDEEEEIWRKKYSWRNKASKRKNLGNSNSNQLSLMELSTGNNLYDFCVYMPRVNHFKRGCEKWKKWRLIPSVAPRWSSPITCNFYFFFLHSCLFQSRFRVPPKSEIAKFFVCLRQVCVRVIMYGTEQQRRGVSFVAVEYSLGNGTKIPICFGSYWPMRILSFFLLFFIGVIGSIVHCRHSVSLLIRLNYGTDMTGY